MVVPLGMAKIYGMEPCSGCGAMAFRHPIVGVGWDQEAMRFDGFPICDPCWRNPQHRTRPLKMHFFERKHEREAVARAGSNQLG